MNQLVNGWWAGTVLRTVFFGFQFPYMKGVRKDEVKNVHTEILSTEWKSFEFPDPYLIII